MRQPVILLIAVATVAVVSGCGGSQQTSWEGPPRPFPADGNLPVDGFADYLEAIDEPWERSLLGIATAYMLPLVQASGDVHAAFPTNDPEGNDMVVVTLGHLFDDSVRELRFVFTMQAFADGSRRMLDAIWQQRCHPGRGHQQWLPRPCI